ncbi:MAG TPA: hypothetical protein VHZ33_13220 [Trebonia sp.]|nr:hypothetical protein [Trebonia sp.]
MELLSPPARYATPSTRPGSAATPIPSRIAIITQPNTQVNRCRGG